MSGEAVQILDHGSVRLIETLRMAPAAQWEIRQFAIAVRDMLAVAFPRTLALFDGTAP